ncbi:glycosyltransferase family 2 protein [Kitasatospora kifunensis]|uniref:GT2 family glycosyltransferase n=1 Tax=Kitasatospora kifunensis TaxID=58351 RepID=A0A7W7VXA0_KITKI|nr:glycosyltransferase family 2 protein [Kitasatospora kifunensis]MBB4925410.1 GT2 family glycosyltransferase [Kitasatospora kifunensis]
MTAYSQQHGYPDQPSSPQLNRGWPGGARPPAYPRHLVTAVIVSHDGARWLPQALAGLLGQDRQVQRILAVDTGSTDTSPQLLRETLGDWLPESGPTVLGRRAGFGTAVAEAVFNSAPLRPEDLPYSLDPSGYDPVTGGWDDFGDPLASADDFNAGSSRETQPVEWLWLLHDDCEPQTDALRRLLQVADSTPSAAVVGPKLRSWYDRRQLLEVGVSIARSGRRWTGLDRREQDQGQHDQVRPVLAVSTAGMLVRRDVFEQLGGFDKALPLMRDDTDFCWRVNAAGHRVVIAPDAVLRHAEAASRERRAIDCGATHPHRVDKAGAVYTLLANSRRLVLPYVLLRLVLGTVLRVLANLVGKDPRQALDEVAGLGHELVRLPRLLTARKRRAATRSYEALDDRGLFPPPGATARLAVETAIGSLGIGGADDNAIGRHGSVEATGGDDDGDVLEIEQFALIKRLARRPAPVLFAALLVVTLIAGRSLLGSGSLLGGALLPADDGASGLWDMYAAAWHPIGTGSTAGAPPYLAVLSVLSWLLFNHAALAVTLVLVLAVPLSAVSAYLVSRPLIGSKLVRCWASAAYALLPAATGAIAQGRLGTAVLAVLLPPLARAAAVSAGLGIRTETAARGARPGWRSTWMTVLLLTLCTAFVPLTWAIALPLALAALLAAVLRGGAYGSGPAALRLLGPRVVAILGVPVLVLAPWFPQVLTHPTRLLLEAGLPGFSGHRAAPLGLLLVNPGGSGVPPIWLSAGVLLAALAALLRADRRRAVLAAWGAAAVGLLFAVLVAGTSVTPASGGLPVAAWAGPATLLSGLALLAAAAIGADGANARVAGIAFGWRQPVAALVVAAAVLAPLGTACWWAVSGADGPLHRSSAGQVPAFIAEEAGTTDRSRTLVLTGDAQAAAVRFTLVRGAGLTLGQAEGTVDTSGDTRDRLTKLVGSLLAGSGADQASALAGYGVAYVLVEGPMIAKVHNVLDTTPGLIGLNQDNGTALWQVSGVPATRAVITAPNTLPVPVPAGSESITATIPAGPAGRVLRLAEQADPGWQASLNGTKLTPVTVDGWAQGFQLPAGGGRLSVDRSTSLLHTGWILAQVLLGLTVLVLALPGRRSTKDDDLPEEVLAAAALAAQAPAPGSRRARRLAERGEGETGEEQGEADSGVYGAPPGIPAQPTGEPYPGTEPVQPAADPYAQDQYRGGGYGEDDFRQADPYGYDPYAAQQSYQPSYAAQPQGYPAEQPYPAEPYAGQGGVPGRPGEQPYVDPGYQGDPYAQQAYQPEYGYGGYDPNGYQGGGEQQPWLPGQGQAYDQDDPSYGGHPRHDGADPRYGADPQ